MIVIDKKATPYFALFAISSVGTVVGTLYGIDAAYKIVYKQTKEGESSNTYRDLFVCCAWFGLAGLSAYMGMTYKNDFFNVGPNESTLFDLSRTKFDIQGYQDQIREKKINKGVFKWFCFALWESALAYENIDKVEKGFFYSTADSIKTSLFKAFNMRQQIENSSNAFLNEIKTKRENLITKYHLFKEKIGEMEYAKGVQIDFNWVCHTPFYLLDRPLCRLERNYQEYLEDYRNLIEAANRLKREWLSEEQLHRCKENYRIRVDHNTLFSEATLKEIEKKI